MTNAPSLFKIVTMLENNGTYPGEPQVYSIWATSNDSVGSWGSFNYKILEGQSHEQSLIDFISSPYVRNPVLLWDRKNGISKAAIKMFPHLTKYL